MLDKGIPFATLSFVLGPLAGNSNSDSSGEASDSLIPNILIKFGIDSDIFGLHHLGDEISDLSDGLGSFSFELGSVCELVNVNGCIDCGLAEAFSLFFFTHHH